MGSDSLTKQTAMSGEEQSFCVRVCACVCVCVCVREETVKERDGKADHDPCNASAVTVVTLLLPPPTTTTMMMKIMK